MLLVEQTCIDMKSQIAINTKETVGWYRCKDVRFRGGTATWELSRTSRYSFLEAYKMAPHRQLIGAKDDEALRKFVKAWGPLRYSLDVWEGSDLVETYRKERDRFATGARFLASVEDPESQRSALLALSELGRKDVDSPYQFLLRGLRLDFGIPGGTAEFSFDPALHAWLETATQKQIEDAVTHIVPGFAMGVLIPGYRTERQGSATVLKISLGISSLLEALSWMVWQDVFEGHPVKFCCECRNPINSTGKYERKFCSYECAHRKSSRDSAKRKREERKRKNGIEKTR